MFYLSNYSKHVLSNYIGSSALSYLIVGVSPKDTELVCGNAQNPEQLHRPNSPIKKKRPI